MFTKLIELEIFRNTSFSLIIAQQNSINLWFWRDDTLGNPNVSCHLWYVVVGSLTEYLNFHEQKKISLSLSLSSKVQIYGRFSIIESLLTIISHCTQGEFVLAIQMIGINLIGNLNRVKKCWILFKFRCLLSNLLLINIIELNF